MGKMTRRELLIGLASAGSIAGAAAGVVPNKMRLAVISVVTPVSGMVETSANPLFRELFGALRRLGYSKARISLSAAFPVKVTLNVPRRLFSRRLISDRTLFSPFHPEWCSFSRVRPRRYLLLATPPILCLSGSLATLLIRTATLLG